MRTTYKMNERIGINKKNGVSIYECGRCGKPCSGRWTCRACEQKKKNCRIGNRIKKVKK